MESVLSAFFSWVERGDDPPKDKTTAHRSPVHRVNRIKRLKDGRKAMVPVDGQYKTYLNRHVARSALAGARNYARVRTSRNGYMLLSINGGMEDDFAITGDDLRDAIKSRCSGEPLLADIHVDFNYDRFDPDPDTVVVTVGGDDEADG